MSGFSELIKNFEKTRDHVRDFFIYGFKVRNDFERKSARTYDDEKRRVESWLGDFLRYDDSVRGRQIAISVDSGHAPENPLYQAYYSKSFTDNDIKLHFLLLDILAQGECLRLREISGRLDEDYGEFFDEQTVRNKLKEYVGEGILLTEKRGKTAYFSLSPDKVSSFTDEYEGLADAVKFFSETQEFGIIGNSILKSAELKNDLFFMKHNYIVHTLEDVILPEILEAIEQKRYLRFRTFKAKNRVNNAEVIDECKVTCSQLIAEIGDVIQLKSGKLLAALAGIDPPPKQSGKDDPKSRSISKRGAPALRKMLFLIMTIYLRCQPTDEPVYQFLDKKRSEGKPYKVYMIAAAHKFLRIYYARVKEAFIDFEPEAAGPI